MIEILRTKLFIPRPRSNLISRHRLVESLNAGLNKKLTLIAAPAGFGKTTLLSEWIPHSPRCVTWLFLDKGDNDPTKFWIYFITSLQQLHTELGASAIRWLQSPPSQMPPLPSILTALINDLAGFPDVFAAVLDDYHLIETLDIHDGLTYLIDHLPANMNLVIATRVDPPLPLSRLRVQNQLTELRANDLRFTPGEAASFLEKTIGLHLSDEDVAVLERRTEGWIAGLQIAALSMQGREDITDFIHAFSGSHRHLLGYLTEEVINRQSEEMGNFLLQTSILARLCGPLCDAVTGGGDGRTILENLVQRNLFITPLDDDGMWFRYHPLFADVLQARLRRDQRFHINELHRRAAIWFSGQGMFDEAVQHALAGANFEQAAQLIEQEAGGMLRKGAAISLIRWLDAVPAQLVRTRPRLALERGWTFLWGPGFSLERADEWAQVALEASRQEAPANRELEGEIYALMALVAADRVDLDRSRELAQYALELLPSDNPWLGVTTFCLGSVLYAAGEFSAATHVLAKALQYSLADHAVYTQLIAASFLADIQVFQGQLNKAMEMYEQVLAWSAGDIPQKGALIAHAGLANVLCEQNQLEAAVSHARMGIDQLEQVGGPGAALWLYQTMVRVQLAQGNQAGAVDAAEEAYRSGRNAQVPFVMAQAAALRASVLLAQGDLESAGVWAARSGLAAQDLQAHSAGLREREYVLLAQVLNAQGSHRDALALLDQLLEPALAEERSGSAIKILAIQSCIHQSQNSATRALDCLEQALVMAESEGYVRSFIEEGELMRSLLVSYHADIRKRLSDRVDSGTLRLLSYSEKLLAAFSQIPFSRGNGGDVFLEPLSERELDVLRLIGAGCTNQEIAAILMIAVSTVKSHINSLYGKLGADRRTQAVAIAREKGILAD